MTVSENILYLAWWWCQFNKTCSL